MSRCTLVILTRNLRLEDNRTLLRAVELKKPILLTFFLTDVQANPAHNNHFAPSSFAFMINCLKDLKSRCPLLILKMTDPTDANEWTRIIEAANTDHVLTAFDSTPFSRERAKALKAACSQQSNKTIFEEVHNDLFLSNFDTLKNISGTPYRIYTPFRNALRSRQKPEKPVKLSKKEFNFVVNNETISDYEAFLPQPVFPVPTPAVRGGRKEADRLLDNLKNFREYSKTRNLPSLPTTLLGAHLKFGTVSPREVWDRVETLFGPAHGLLDQLIWRDFFAYLAYHNPETMKGKSLSDRFKLASHWTKDPKSKAFQKWAAGQTGIPIIDAGMQQLHKTGYMHNRVRMIVANYLTLYLKVHWQLGERHFSQYLIDYDPSSNTGNWQWNSGVGADPPKYGKPRIFNPAIQSKKYDPDGAYVKQWGQK